MRLSHILDSLLHVCCNVSCIRLLGHSSEMNSAGALTVSVDGREVAITCIHVGVDLPRVQQALDARYSTVPILFIALWTAYSSFHVALAWCEQSFSQSLLSLLAPSSSASLSYTHSRNVDDIDASNLFECSTFEAEMRLWRDPFPGKTIVAGKIRRYTIRYNTVM